MIPNLPPQYLKASQYLKIPLAIRLPPQIQGTLLYNLNRLKKSINHYIYGRGGYGDVPSPMKLISCEAYEVDKIVDIFKPLTVN